MRWKECTYVSAPLAVVLTLILCFEALLFLLFTAIMFCVGVHILHLSPVLARINREYVHSNCCLDSKLVSVSIRAKFALELQLWDKMLNPINCTQMHAISVDETGIEQLKGEKNLGNKSKWANFKQVFGYQPTWTWFLLRVFIFYILRSCNYLKGNIETKTEIYV